MKKDYSEYIGKQFGELTILSISEPVTENNSQRICKCKCSCGKEVQTNFSSVLFGSTSSCGHLKVAKGSKSLQKIIQIKRTNKTPTRQINQRALNTCITTHEQISGLSTSQLTE